MSGQELCNAAIALNLDAGIIAGSAMGLLRITAEFLLLCSNKTPTKIGTALKVAAKLIAFFGLGKPKKL